MFLRCTVRKKDGKEHRYWSVVENRRVADGKVVQRQVLYLGEINDSQRESWLRTIEVIEDGHPLPKTMALFPDDRTIEVDSDDVVKIRLNDLELCRPRQFGACWLAVTLYEQLGLDQFWAKRLPPSRKGTRWDLIAEALCCYRFIDPGSEWRLHRHWYETSAMGDLLGDVRAMISRTYMAGPKPCMKWPIFRSCYGSSRTSPPSRSPAAPWHTSNGRPASVSWHGAR